MVRSTRPFRFPCNGGRARFVTVVAGKGPQCRIEQCRIEVDRLLVALEQGALEVVVFDDTAATVKCPFVVPISAAAG
jgi:hypothetical protein